MLNEGTKILEFLLILLAICFVISIIFRMIRVAIVIGILCFILPGIFTILSGDGEEYVSKFAGMFQPSVEEQINDGYEVFQQKVKESPSVDLEGVKEFGCYVVDEASSAIRGFVNKGKPSEPVFPPR